MAIAKGLIKVELRPRPKVSNKFYGLPCLLFLVFLLAEIFPGFSSFVKVRSWKVASTRFSLELLLLRNKYIYQHIPFVFTNIYFTCCSSLSGLHTKPFWQLWSGSKQAAGKKGQYWSGSSLENQLEKENLE